MDSKSNTNKTDCTDKPQGQTTPNVGAACANPTSVTAGAPAATNATGGNAPEGAATSQAAGAAPRAAGDPNPAAEHAFWRNEFSKRPYVATGANYDQYGPAYQYGWESQAKHSGKGQQFDAVEKDLQKEWEGRRGTSKLNWDDAKVAARDSWDRSGTPTAAVAVTA